MFLPKEEKVEQAPSQFLRLEEGEHRFRVLDSAVVGWVGWDKEAEPPKPIRTKEHENFPLDKIDPERQPKRFWSFPIWNFDVKRIQTLELTQKTVMKALLTYTKDEDYGDPQNYDVVITRTGKGMDTEYSLIAKPPKVLDEKIVEQFETLKKNGGYDIEKIFKGEYPLDDTKVNKLNSDRELSPQESMEEIEV